ncbi:hypothetical protein GWR56_02445 [Mucilaginibacter sp. 14171R-50]|uniref:hypothetical protein n=1 Tax=Mucilaginibacter sp. 14171R-50 TaxID=2703789 RepID=UPI00138D7E9A|nr:hypothetical protein [Mucilaginibacter sp. 14171R-50]QHS54456.1 hypothetical protein GWR56_02445 [Mucilaginibacter sp. 14171R-50]
MKHLLATLLHVFVIFMMVSFIIGAILAATGTFDHWAERYRLKRRRRRLIKSKRLEDNITPYHAAKPDRSSVTYTGNV